MTTTNSHILMKQARRASYNMKLQSRNHQHFTIRSAAHSSLELSSTRATYLQIFSISLWYIKYPDAETTDRTAFLFHSLVVYQTSNKPIGIQHIPSHPIPSHPRTTQMQHTPYVHGLIPSSKHDIHGIAAHQSSSMKKFP